MQKLRALYAETQNNAKDNFDKVNLQRCKKILAYVNKQSEKTNAQNDHSQFLEIIFYHEKFSLIIDKFNAAINQKTKKSKLQADVLTILAQDFKPNGERPPAQANSPLLPPPKRVQLAAEKPKFRQQKDQPKVEPDPKSSITFKNVQDPKTLINSYFDFKKSEIQRSQAGFRSVIQDIPKPSQNYAIKPSIKQANDGNIVKLTKKIQQLTKDLQNSRASSEFSQGLIYLQKQKYESRIKDLSKEVERLNHENSKLKMQPQPLVHSKQDLSAQGPHVIKYRSNDLFRLNKMYEGQLPYHSFHNRKDKPAIFGVKITEELVHKSKEEEILLKAFPEHFSEPARSEYDFQKSNVRFNRSQAWSQENNVIVRSKLSFFKSSMVLYRGEQFELAIKSDDLIPLQSRKVTIYVNNKGKYHRNLQITYKSDPNYYDIKILKKLNEVEGSKQGKQQIEVTLKGKSDLDALIEARLQIIDKTLIFFIPTMMIQMLKQRPLNLKKDHYAKSIVSPLINQFSSIYSAMEVIPLEKDTIDRAEVGSVYARSKYFEGHITLRWKDRNQLQIQTINPWLLFLSYLMIKEY